MEGPATRYILPHMALARGPRMRARLVTTKAVLKCASIPTTIGEWKHKVRHVHHVCMISVLVQHQSDLLLDIHLILISCCVLNILRLCICVSMSAHLICNISECPKISFHFPSHSMNVVLPPVVVQRNPECSSQEYNVVPSYLKKSALTGMYVHD